MEIVPPKTPQPNPETIAKRISRFPNPRSRSRPTEVRWQIFAQGPEEGPRHKREDHRFRAQVFREEGVRFLPSKLSRQRHEKEGKLTSSNIESKFLRVSRTRVAPVVNDYPNSPLPPPPQSHARAHCTIIPDKGGKKKEVKKKIRGTSRRVLLCSFHTLLERTFSFHRGLVGVCGRSGDRGAE